MIKQTFKYFFISVLFASCSSKQSADLIIRHAKIYTVDSLFTVAEAIAIKDGRILATGTDNEILEQFNPKQIKDAEGKYIYPGFIDSHCHFLSYGLGLRQLDLVGTRSFDEVIERIKRYEKADSSDWIIGRGWDQNDWTLKEYPDRRKLDSLFPNTPVILKRIDGHAALVNGEALRRASISNSTKVEGGEILKFESSSSLKSRIDHLTGILVDNAVDLVTKVIPPPSKKRIRQSLASAQENCFAVGLTTVDDAGLNKNEIAIIDELQKSGDLKMRIYAMLTPNEENLKHYLANGIYKTDKLTVRAFKLYADGALGSRGACLIGPYNDKPGSSGFLLNKKLYFQELAAKLVDQGFQMNSHCIGDSAVRLMLCIYSAFIPDKSDRRWRIEHAQVTTKADLLKFNKNCIPSVQPTHATSDMYWAEQRLGKDRMKYAYAYKDLLKATGMLALGTDFPVEDISPFKTFYAAIFRKDSKGFPESGFQMENSLTREETIRAMTIWGAYANFEEHEKGSLEKGKFADMVILDNDLMQCAEDKILQTKVISTFVGGEEVYKKNK